jgi:pimeloyl-ACP methyl ester carboxylesterase
MTRPRPIILLPGLDGSGRMFRGMLETAPSTFAPRAVSYPTDQVRSYAELEPVVEASLPTDGPFVLLGESFAGPLAIRIAAKNPPGLIALVLVATFARAPVPGWMRRLGWLVTPRLLSRPPPAFLLRALLVGKDADDELIAQFRASAGSVKPEVMAARVRTVLDVDVTSQWATCSVPALYIRALDEKLLRAGIPEELKALKPDLEIGELPGPHLVLRRHPREAWELISRFVDRVSG